MSTIAVSLEKVAKTFAGNAEPALAGVSLDILRNEFFTLLGPSGCGKTTLLRLIAGFEMPDSGAIAVDGVPLVGVPANRRPVNTVFQSYALFPHMTVAENIGFGLEMLGRRKDEIQARVATIIAMLRLDGLAARRPSQLSGGQQQRVALGRALAPAPKVLLLDEPLSALDLKLRKEMQIELKRLQAETGITFVFVTHDQEEALTMSDRIAVMRGGRIVQTGSPTEIYENPSDVFVAEFIGEANFWPATCVSRSGATATFRLADGGAVLSVAASADILPGQSSTLVVRPERLVPDAAGVLIADIVHVVYRGSDALLDMRLPDGTPARARVPGSGAPNGLAGRRMCFSIPSEAVRVFTP